jgi:hypothetical protein
MILKRFFLITCVFMYCQAFAQDTLYLKHDPGEMDSRIKNINPDSLFIVVNDVVLALDYVEDSVITDFNNGIYTKVKKFYILLNKRSIEDSCSYYFWMKNGSDYIPFFVLGIQIINSKSTIYFQLYHYKHKLAFWKNRLIGFVISLNQGFSGSSGKVKQIGDYSPECTHIWGKKACEFNEISLEKIIQNYYYPPMKKVGFSDVQDSLEVVSISDLAWNNTHFNLTVLKDYYFEYMGYGYVFSCYHSNFNQDRFLGGNSTYILNPNPSDTLMLTWNEEVDQDWGDGVLYDGVASSRPFLIYHIKSKQVFCCSMDFLTKVKW